MIAILLLLYYTCYIIIIISGVAVLYHRRSTVHSIFQISISGNTNGVGKTGFPRPGISGLTFSQNDLKNFICQTVIIISAH